ncbi:MAG TPA: glycosyltransferase family 2 protein [Bacteroidia bacterium]|jgi:glycosyltransferase involved in cell wall biosynthesis|nr:glycosyltransferase family 2 protein [Bacteroidia bacterium]HMU18833.1 glycosyltransferase family 2 protein [Bacteroidia bacterium]
MLTDKKPFFSVIMPVYNRADLVKDSIASVLSQRFDDFELICIDDGSTDNTLLVLKEIAKKDKRIKLISHQNRGRCAARNEGINAAYGEWIAFLDSDDFYLENHLSIMYQLIQKFPSFSGLATELVVESKIRDYANCNYFKDQKVFDLNDFAEANPISLNQFCYKKSNYPELLFPDINILTAEDLLFFRMFSYKFKILKSGIITNFVNSHVNRSMNLISTEQFVYWNKFATDYFIDNYSLPDKITSKMRQNLQLFISNVYLSSNNIKKGLGELIKVMKYPSTYTDIHFYKAIAKIFIN